jgi:hypothetical protein
VGRGEQIRGRLPGTTRAEAASLNGLRIPSDSLVIQPPDGDRESSDLHLVLDKEAQDTGIHIEIQSGNDVFSHFVPPGSASVRLRFMYESGPKLIWCARHGSYVTPDENGRCPIHH